MYSYYHSLDGATLFPKVALNKLCHNVHSKVTLISAKFGADMITISKDTDHKTKCPRWPRFLAYPVGQLPYFKKSQNTKNDKCSRKQHIVL